MGGMNPGRKKLGRKMEAAVAALLAEPSHRAAAARAGVAESTLHRWLRDEPGFAAAYRAARRAVVEHAVAQLQALTGDAVARLRANLTCGTPHAEIRAAVAILGHALRGVEVLDVLARVQELERRDAEQERSHDAGGELDAPCGTPGEAAGAAGLDGQPDPDAPAEGPDGGDGVGGAEAGQVAGGDPQGLSEWAKLCDGTDRDDPAVQPPVGKVNGRGRPGAA
jgi:hypothetical protein